MITIGIRATPRSVTFAVYNSKQQRIVNVEDLKIPAAFAVPDGLKYLRSNLLDVLREFRIEKAGVRVTEPTADPNAERVQIEGVVQETFASSDLKGYYVGQISSISSRVGIDRKRFKPMVDGAEDPGVENWNAMTKEQREAVLCAIGAVNA